MTLPDVETLRLCSTLASMAYGFVFAVLWLRDREALHLAMWAASSLLYGAVIAIFSILPIGATAVSTIPFALLAVSNVLPVAGAAWFEGKPLFARWMVLPVIAAGGGHAVPAMLAARGWIASDGPWQTLGDAGGLAVSIAVSGAVLAFGPGARLSAGRRLAGAAMLAYLPAYALSIAGEFTVLQHRELVALLAMLSDQLLLGILNLGLLAIPVEQVQRDLRDAARRDPLTGCWNRAGLKAVEAGFFSEGAAAIAIDVDHFKAVNDRYGHAVGDDVLALIGREATALASRFGGHAARVGGDELVILIPPAKGAAADFMALLRNRLAAGGAVGTGWTVSMGVGEVRAGDPVIDCALERADRSLYQAKAARPEQAGRTIRPQNRAAASSARR